MANSYILHLFVIGFILKTQTEQESVISNRVYFIIFFFVFFLLSLVPT